MCKEELLETRRYLVSSIKVLKHEIKEKQGYLKEDERELEEIEKQLAQITAKEKEEKERHAAFMRKIVETGEQSHKEAMREAYNPNFNVFLIVEAKIQKVNNDEYKAYRVAFMQFDGGKENMLANLTNVRSSEIKRLNAWILDGITKYKPAVMWTDGDLGKIAIRSIEDCGISIQKNTDIDYFLGPW